MREAIEMTSLLFLFGFFSFVVFYLVAARLKRRRNRLAGLD